MVFSAIGLFTLYIGVDLMSGIHTPVAVFVALVIGAALGHAMGVDRRVRAAADKLGNGTGSRIGAIHPPLLCWRHDTGRLHA